MDINAVRLFLCGVSLIDLVLGGYSGYVNPRGSKWTRQGCLQMGGDGVSCDLSTRPVNDTGFWDYASLTTNTYYWVGARKRDVLQWKDGGEPLVQTVGCYAVDSAVSGYNSRDMRTYTNPVRCLSYCDGNYVALQNTKCHCISKETVATLEQRPLDECHVICPYSDSNPSRCGGVVTDRVSVYKIPDRTVLQVVGRSKKFFWRRSSNNQEELVVITNKPGTKQGRVCVSASGDYSVLEGKGVNCAGGSEPLTFKDGTVTDFLQKTSARTDMDDVDFLLDLGYLRGLVWLNGLKVFKPQGSSGGCVAVMYDGSNYFLEKKPCSMAFASVCACYEKPQTTTPELMSITSTTESTTSTTTPATTSTTTQPPTTTTTTPTTTTTTPPPTTTTTTPPPTTSTTTPRPTTITTIPPSTTPTTTTPPPTTTTTPPPSTTMTTETTSTTTIQLSPTTTTMTTSHTTTTAQASTSTQETSPPSTVPAKPLGFSQATVSSSKATDDPFHSSTTVLNDARDFVPQENSTLLFPFHSANASDVLLRQGPGAPEKSQDGAASAGLSVGVIVGIAVTAVVVAIIVVVVVAMVLRGRNSASTSLLKEKSSKSNTSYPI